MATENRINKIEEVLSKKQPDLAVVCENIYDPHNVSAIFRTCDATGVLDVHLLYNKFEFPEIGSRSSAGVRKWIRQHKYKEAEHCFNKLKEDGYQVLATRLDDDAISIYEFDLTQKIAIVMGNEHSGISPEFTNFCDKKIYIPIHGMVESLNVSVATAVILYETYRQRHNKGYYSKCRLSDSEMDHLRKLWLYGRLS